MESQPTSFEEDFGRLQQAIEKLEQGSLPLEESLRLFEQSMALAASCREMLESAELRLTQLVEERAGDLGDLDQE